MPTIPVNINISTIGVDAGPFTVSDNVLGVLATNVPRTSLLGNYIVNADTTATQITVTSTGNCTNSLIIPIDFHPCGTGPFPTVYYYFTMVECCGGSNLIGRTTNPSLPANTYLYSSNCYTRGSATSGPTYQIDLDVTPTVSGCLDPACPSCPPPSNCRQNVVINVTDTGFIKYYNCTTETTEFQFISSLGNVTLTNCLDYTTLLPGFPLADVANFTIVSNGVACSAPPPPPPPPPPTPSSFDYDCIDGVCTYMGPGAGTYTAEECPLFCSPTPPPPPPPTPSEGNCYTLTYTTIPGDLFVRYRRISDDTIVTELINSLETMDNGNGTYTAAICVSTIAPYNIPTCVQGGVEVTCDPYTWDLGSTCTFNGQCFLL